MTFEEAKQTIESQFKPSFLGEEEAVLLEAYNRVLSQDVISPMDIPAFNTSCVAGYAVKAADVINASEDQAITLTIVDSLNAGENPRIPLKSGEAFEVSTSAVLPQGADAIIELEDTERQDNTLQVYTPAQGGDNILKAGFDIKTGQVVLKKGQVLGSTEIGVLAALGLKYVKVLRIPIIAVLSVSNEVSELGNTLLPGKSFDLNGYSISTAIMECGAKPVYFGVTPLNKSEIARIVSTAISGSDMTIICTDNTDVAEIVDQLGKPGLVINGVAIKPGKSTAAAFVGAKPVFIFPSNPSSAIMMYQLFARSQVQRLSGRPIATLRVLSAFAGSKIFSAKGSRTFTPVLLAFDEQCRLIAEPIETKGAVTTLAAADGFVEIAENEQIIEADQEVAVLLLRGLATRT